jgi:hypothetical protein
MLGAGAVRVSLESRRARRRLGEVCRRRRQRFMLRVKSEREMGVEER